MFKWIANKFKARLIKEQKLLVAQNRWFYDDAKHRLDTWDQLKGDKYLRLGVFLDIKKQRQEDILKNNKLPLDSELSGVLLEINKFYMRVYSDDETRLYPEHTMYSFADEFTPIRFKMGNYDDDAEEEEEEEDDDDDTDEDNSEPIEKVTKTKLKYPVEIEGPIRDNGVVIAIAKTEDGGSTVVAWDNLKSMWVTTDGDFTIGDVLKSPPLTNEALLNDIEKSQ